jgi:hypothetical protein
MKIEKFNDRLIAFDFESEMVNATDLAKQYNRRPNDFLNLESTKAFIEAFKSDTIQNGIVDFQPVITVKGGFTKENSQGTWMHRILAYKFAAWLNPEIELFVYKTFDAIVKEAARLQDEKLNDQQRQLDYFWDKEDNNDIYRRK